MANSTTRYSDDMVIDMLLMRDEGFSATEIANNMNGLYGVTITRNAVLGKFFRIREEEKCNDS